MNTTILEATDASFTSEVLQSNIPVLVDFWALWCGHCIRFTPTIEEVMKNYSGKVKCVKVEVDKNPTLVSTYNIRSIPTLMLFKSGKAIATNNGALDKIKLKEFIDTNLSLQ